MDDMCKRMPFDYASYQVGLGRLEVAIETLEQGRALLWSEMRGLRTPIVEPVEEDLPLAKKLAEINQELEMVALSSRTKQEVRSRKPWSSGNAHPSLISTPEDFFDRGNKLNDRLLDVRNNCGLDSPEYELALDFVLSELYQLVGRPIIRRLRELGIPEQSRIWWCPTSVFCSLPLHAMGPIPQTNEVKAKPQYISDLYICSYTPTLSALIESRNRDPYPSGNSSLLLVAQPDVYLPDAQAEIKIIQALSVPVTSLVSEDATSSTVVDGLRNHQLLHEGDRLTLLEIVRSRLPSAEFAFLAACHTAELTEASLPDEGLHLVAAMQYCGFRGAVGTMWAMADIDGPDLARHFYKSMLSKKKEGIPYYERAAEALRDAVQKLRRKKGFPLSDG
ncbi:hypothetical protein H4582DRAFT_2071655 [Lactarius indigo]|nr:hypothetical protein H4582DRAFT_2071655 [Lactarius indigo]